MSLKYFIKEITFKYFFRYDTVEASRESIVRNKKGFVTAL